eukprot:5659747-Alexandrium_andersonii.AAC.1
MSQQTCPVPRGRRIGGTILAMLRPGVTGVLQSESMCGSLHRVLRAGGGERGESASAGCQR